MIYPRKFSGTQIQFAIEFRLLIESCLPSPRFLAVNISYEDDSMLANYALSEEKSSSSSKIIGFYFKSSLGSDCTESQNQSLRCEYRRASSQILQPLLQMAHGRRRQTERHGQHIITTDRGNDTTYIRYTPTSIADNIRNRTSHCTCLISILWQSHFQNDKTSLSFQISNYYQRAEHTMKTT